MAKKKGKNELSVLILRATDFEGGVIPPEVTQNEQHVIVIKPRQTRVGEEKKQKPEAPVIIVEGNEEMELLESGKLPVGVTDRSVVIVDDIGSL